MRLWSLGESARSGVGKGAVLMILLLSWVTWEAVGAVNHVLDSFEETNYTGYVIASDVNNAGEAYNRDAIEVAAQVTYTRSGGTPHHYTYRFRFELIDELAVAQTLFVGDSMVAWMDVFEDVDMRASADPITRTTTARLRPAVQLDPNREYRVRVTIARRQMDPPEVLYTQVLGATTAAMQYVHFRQLTQSDVALNVFTRLTSAQFGANDRYRIQVDPNRDYFRVAANVVIYRYDEFAGPVGSDEVVTRFNVVLKDDLGNTIPLEQSTFEFSQQVNRFVEAVGSLPRRPVFIGTNRQLELRPVEQLLSRSRTYTAEVTVGHFEVPGITFNESNQRVTQQERLLDFNGTLIINGITGSFGSVATPAPQVIGLGVGYVDTSIRVNGGSGQFQGMSFGNGTELFVQLADTGVATFTGGSIGLIGSGVPLVPAGLFYTLEGMTITPSGITGNVRLRLPSGLGLGHNAQTRIHEPDVVFSGVELTSQFVPVASSLDVAGNWWAAEESKPILFETLGLVWDVADDRIRMVPSGAAQSVRKDAYDTLLFDTEIQPADHRSKASNDGYYWTLNAVTSPEVVINMAADGSALLNMEVAMGGMFIPYRAHFPMNARIRFSSGSQRIVNDRVDPAFGGLVNVDIAELRYGRDCPLGDCGGLAGTVSLNVQPAGGTMAFTRDGGLHGSGILSTPHDLSWGWVASANAFAHTVYGFETAAFNVAGVFLAAAEFGSTVPELRPARMLYTGVNPNATDQVERPGTSAYTAGLGDYAGINFRVPDWGDHDATLVLAGNVQPPFPLTNRAKYLVRLGGVSGIHEAVNGQFNPVATIYGVDFEFSALGWGFLDGEAVISRTAGGLFVPFPSDFGLAFEKLMISCIGALEGAEIAAADHGVLNKLAYWNADFRPLALSFEGPEAAACDPGNRRLVLGVEVFAGGISQPLSGRIAFSLNGNLVTRDSKELDPPFDSRFRLPNNFQLAGPGGQTYRATPVGEAYLNNYAAAMNADFGWMNIAAYLDVPFFSDLETHIHTSAAKDDDNVLYHIMGGYPDDGYRVGDAHFFNQEIFDTNNRGFPNDVTYSQYRAGVEKYRPVAVKRWLGVVDFKYPLTWRPASRSFVSFKDVTNKFVVLNAEHRVDYMSPDFVDVSFGASLSLVPQINIANFVSDKAGDVLNVLQAHLQTNTVDAGVRALNEILDVKQREFFELALRPAIDASVDTVISALIGNWNAGDKTWDNNDLFSVVNGALNHPFNGVVAQVETVMKAVGQGIGILHEIDNRLQFAEDALTAIESFISEKNGNALGDMQEAVIGLASLVSAALQKPEFLEKIEALLAQAEPRIIEVRKVIGEIRTYITEVRDALGEGGAFAAQVIQLVDTNVAQMQGAVASVRSDILSKVNQIHVGLDSLPQMEANLRAAIKQRIEDYVLGLPIMAQVNRLIKQRVYDTAALFTAAIDEVFDQINSTVRDVVREVAGGLDDKFDAMLDDLGATMATADIKGYAKIRNDSLTELRMDLKAQLNVPDEMKANVYLFIRELNSENTGSDCLPASGKATEVTMGAKDVSVEWLFPDTSINLNAKFSFTNEEGEGLKLRGFGGGMMIVGEISFGESIVIHQLGASVMFGLDEAYISAAAKLEVQGFAGGGGIFFGRACSLDPFFWDDTVAAAIGKPPFTGMYGYGEFWIPIPTLIGIPSTCLFNLSAGVGAGAGFFIEGPTVFGKMFLGVSGDVLCIISITGEISLVGVARPSGLSLAGKGRFKAELGWCPLCLKVEKTILMARENKKWTRKVD